MADVAEIAGQTVIILVAAGRGSRAGDGMPKQYRRVTGVPIIRRTVDALINALPGARILPIIHPDDTDLCADSLDSASNIMAPVFGGATRQESVFNALQSLAVNAPDFVQIHDAARPFVGKDMMARICGALEAGATGVVPAVPVVDTLVKTKDGNRQPVDRKHLYAVQTPQAFRFDSIFRAHRNANGNGYTDDASIFEAAGGITTQVQGDERNFKITQPEDFMKAEAMTQTNLTDVRVGSGYDVHRFDAGDSVWLCGIEVPHTHSLKGHSDADVALHALTDAVLAAIADGDIGSHFPPTDEKWRGAPSHMFLSHACNLVRERGGNINHLGVTIICEAPKIRPHVDTMRARIADIARLNVDRVSIQATTTEKLGFTGRGEGIAAQATATIALPDPGHCK